MKKHRKDFITKSELRQALFICSNFAEMAIEIKKLKKGTFEVADDNSSFGELLKFRNNTSYAIFRINEADVETIKKVKKWYRNDW